ncbi:MAG TPA: NADH-quinone oxidoreductase subunit N, partial [Longimicrobiales bacterium]
MTIDFSNPAHYALAMLPETVLSVWAMILLLVDVFQKGDETKPSRRSIGWLALVGIILAAVANGWLLTQEATSNTGMIALDEFRVFSNFLCLLAAAMFVLISERYLEHEGLQWGEVHVLVLLATVGMMVFAGANDLMVAFIGLEMMSVPVYVLTGINRRDPRSAEGALKYFLLGAFSSAFFLFGVALVYGATQTTVLPLIAAAAASNSDNLLLIGGIGMLAVGFGFKVAAVPFHMWTPDAYEGAPAIVTGFMSTGVKAAAFAAFARVFLSSFEPFSREWAPVIWILAAAT